MMDERRHIKRKASYATARIRKKLHPVLFMLHGVRQYRYYNSPDNQRIQLRHFLNCQSPRASSKCRGAL